MRAKDLLTEYRRDVTAQKMGDKLIQAFMRVERPSNLPDVLYGAWTVADMVYRPERYDDGRNFRFDVFGTMTMLNKEVAPQILETIKPKMVELILEQLEQGDPTPHKEYTQWIASRYITGDTKLEDIGSTLQEYLYKFNILKRKKMLKPPANDINRYPSFSNFMDNMDEYDLPEDEVVNKGKVTEVYQDADVRIVVPEDQTAACYYGQGTRWCTASTRGTNYYGHYARQGPLYILIPTKAKHEGEKYQLHFPSEQFMDEDDDPVSLNYVINDRFHVLDFFKQQEPEVNEYIEYVDDSVLAPLLAKIAEIARDWMWSELTDWETQDDYYTQWQAEYARRLGYVDDEGDVDWEKVHDDDDLNNYLEFNDDARSWEHEISTALDYTPRMVKAFAADPRDGNDHESYKLDQLDSLVSRIVNYETGMREREPNHIAAMIKDRIGVRKTGDHWEVFNSGWSTGRGR